MNIPAFSDPRIAAVLKQIREAETIQAIARLRLVWAKYQKRVFLLSNALHPDRMTAHERRTELYSLLAIAVVRFMDPDRHHLLNNTGDSSLHFPRKQSGTAAPTVLSQILFEFECRHRPDIITLRAQQTAEMR
jgi:hypothetical protein